MTLAPFLFIHLSAVACGGITEFTFTDIGTKVLPRAQSWNALSGRRLICRAWAEACESITCSARIWPEDKNSQQY